MAANHPFDDAGMQLITYSSSESLNNTLR